MLTIIGCGNLNRSDDGVGVLIAQRIQRALQDTPLLNVRVYDCGTGGMEVMFQARGSTALIIIDASSTGSEPGAIYQVPGEVLEQLPTQGYSLHDFRWDHAIAAGRKIFGEDFPSEVTVYLIEAENLGLGLELSPSVAKAAEQVYAELMLKLQA
ncbi:MAG: hydrogenase maturation protease [Oculatellaceae cyanobacterium Prado106]|jgi:hydrogenase maturation protease|nr:hydrogenase maturation protease [Oculatellaceae cyanobacterium Prado106]